MNPNREEVLFQLALIMPASEPVAFLDRESSADKVLRARIEAVLTAHELPEPTKKESELTFGMI